jgi:cell division protein FtsB
MASPASRASGRSRPGSGGGPGPGRTTAASQRRSPSTRRTSRAMAASADADARKPRLTRRTAILALLLAVLVVSYASSLRVWLEQRREISGLESQIATTKASVAQMRQEKARWHDPAYIEAQARERFTWVLPGEIGFRVINSGGDPAGSQLLGTAQPSSIGEEWWQRTWGSVLAAAEEPKADKGPTRQPANKIGTNSGSGRGSDGPGG